MCREQGRVVPTLRTTQGTQASPRLSRYHHGRVVRVPSVASSTEGTLLDLADALGPARCRSLYGWPAVASASDSAIQPLLSALDAKALDCSRAVPWSPVCGFSVSPFLWVLGRIMCVRERRRVGRGECILYAYERWDSRMSMSWCAPSQQTKKQEFKTKAGLRWTEASLVSFGQSCTVYIEEVGSLQEHKYRSEHHRDFRRKSAGGEATKRHNGRRTVLNQIWRERRDV